MHMDMGQRLACLQKVRISIGACFTSLRLVLTSCGLVAPRLTCGKPPYPGEGRAEAWCGLAITTGTIGLMLWLLFSSDPESLLRCLFPQPVVNQAWVCVLQLWPTMVRRVLLLRKDLCRLPLQLAPHCTVRCVPHMSSQKRNPQPATL
ncbi:hypothetical protein L218DRAFT_385613 [Marasmius fiardii PR-910]|nr:hypothetical protein L218DRAFT_385613 [Marasmius fiardii PR-910]